MERINQTTVIKDAINSCMDKGVTDKKDIYQKVVDELGVPRPTVRRVARDLRNELLEKIRILQAADVAKEGGVQAAQQKIRILQSQVGA